MSGVRSTGADGAAEVGTAAAAGARGTLDGRGGELGRSPAIGLTLGVPGRGGASGKELRWPEPSDGGDDGGVRKPSGIAGAGGNGVTIAGADGIVGSLAAGDFASAARVAGSRVTGGGGGVCELRAGASTNSMSASASISDSSFGSIISVI